MKSLWTVMFTALSCLTAYGLAWDQETPMPQGRTGFACVSVADKIYVIGGHDESGTGVTEFQTMLVYDTVQKTWSEKAGPPRGYTSAASVVYKGWIYLMGGFVPHENSSSSVYRYNVHTETWETCQSMPADRANAGAVVMNERIYVFGGRSWPGWAYHNTVFVYDPTNDYPGSAISAWSTTFSHPGRLDGYPLGDNAAIAVKGRVFLFGGNSGTSVFSYMYDEVWAFDPDAKNAGQAWTLIRHMPAKRGGHGLEFAYGYVIVLGGFGPWDGSGNPPCSTLWVFLPEYNMSLGPTVSTPVPFGSGGTAVVNGRIYILGGDQDVTYGGPASANCWSFQK